MARMNAAFERTRRISATGFITACVLALHTFATNPGSSADYYAQRVHDPCIAKDGGNYYVFSTNRGIGIRQSTDMVNWKYAGRIFDAVPDWARREIPGARDFWAPDVSRFNGQFHLYYAVSTFGSKHSVIGLATNKALDPKSPDYHWKDCGKVIQTGDKEDWNAIDPSIFLDGDTPWLSFGSFWSGIKLVRIDAVTGKPANDRLTSLAARPKEKSVEAPCIVKHGRFYFLFVSFDHCCRGVNSDYKIMVGRAERVEGPYSDKQGRPMLEGNAALILQGDGHRIRGPGGQSVLVEGDKYWLTYHFYDADSNGIPSLQIRPLKWENDWPVAGDPLPGMKQPDNSQPFRRGRF
jgi:arabinan endo-1,5-alpha-L-arabinosidase